VDPLLAVLGPIATLVGVLAAAWFTYRAANRRLRQDSRLGWANEYQEDIATLRKELANSQRTGRLKDDYISVLRQHIADHQEPPPPPYPPGLTA
jgi:hypothetical protein